MKNTTYYFTDPFEIRASKASFCGIVSPRSKELIYRICIYLHWTRDILPQLPVFGKYLTTWELCHIIEEFYDCEKVLIPYDEIHDDFIEINIENNRNDYLSYSKDPEFINHLKIYDIDHANFEMLAILFDHFMLPVAFNYPEEIAQIKQFLQDYTIQKEWAWKDGFQRQITTLALFIEERAMPF